jgi:hypothetical protein
MSQNTVLRFLDAQKKADEQAERDRKKRSQQVRDQICEQLGYLRKMPDNEDAQAVLDQLRDESDENKALYLEVYAEDDRQHGGDGTGSSWLKAKMMLGGSSP